MARAGAGVGPVHAAASGACAARRLPLAQLALSYVVPAAPRRLALAGVARLLSRESILAGKVATARSSARRNVAACAMMDTREVAAPTCDDGHAEVAAYLRSRNAASTTSCAERAAARARDGQAPVPARRRSTPGSRRKVARSPTSAPRSRAAADHRGQPRSAARMGGARIGQRSRGPRLRQPRGSRPASPKAPRRSRRCTGSTTRRRVQRSAGARERLPGGGRRRASNGRGARRGSCSRPAIR